MFYYSVGQNWTRREFVRDPTTNLYLPGYRLEPARTAFYTWDYLNPAVWTSVPGGMSNAADGISPITGTTTRRWYTAGGGWPQAFYVYDDVATSPAAGVTVCLSAFFRPYATTDLSMWCKLHWYQSGFPDSECWAWFNVTNGQLGSIGAGNVTPICRGMEFWNPWWRCWITFTTLTDLSAAAHRVRIGVTSADGVHTCDAINRGVTAVCIQDEIGDYPSSYMRGGTTRTADSQIIYTIGTFTQTFPNRRGSLIMPFRVSSHVPQAETDILKLYLAAGPATDYIKLSWCATTGYLKVTSARTGATTMSITNPTNICDGNVHWLAVNWSDARLSAWVDNTEAFTPDVSPPWLDTLAYQPCGGWMGQVTAWPDIYTPAQMRKLDPGLRLFGIHEVLNTG